MDDRRAEPANQSLIVAHQAREWRRGPWGYGMWQEEAVSETLPQFDPREQCSVSAALDALNPKNGRAPTDVGPAATLQDVSLGGHRSVGAALSRRSQGTATLQTTPVVLPKNGCDPPKNR